MEGISHEACALAGAWKLNKLMRCTRQRISSTARSPLVCRNTPLRFPLTDGTDAPSTGTERGGRHARPHRTPKTAPTTHADRLQDHIAKAPEPRQHRQSPRRAAGREEIKLTREALGWTHAPFELPKEAYEAWDAKAKGLALEARLGREIHRLQGGHPELAAEFTRRMKGELPRAFLADRGGHRGWRPHQGRDRGFAQGLAARARSLHRRPAGNAGWLGRLTGSN